MKVLSIIGMVLVMVLSLVPCSDAVATLKGDIKNEVHKTADQHEGMSNDACSPFCHCSCCSMLSLVIISTAKYTPYPTYGLSYVPHDMGTFIDISLPVWQPPQLG